MEVKLGSGKLQKLRLEGIPYGILRWDQGDTEFTQGVLEFCQFFQLSCFVIKDLSLSVQGFHYMNKNQGTKDSIVSVIPLNFIKPVKKKNLKEIKNNY